MNKINEKNPSKGLSRAQKNILRYMWKNNGQIRFDAFKVPIFNYYGNERIKIGTGSDWRSYQRLCNRGLIQKVYGGKKIAKAVVLTELGKEVANLLSMKQLQNGSPS